MTEHSRDDLWRDFPKAATEFEARFASEEAARAYWIEARTRWGGKAGVRALPEHAGLDDPRGHDVRVRRLRSSDEPDLGHAAGEDAQALEDVAPRHVRDLQRRAGISAMTLSAFWGLAPTRRRGVGCTSSGRRWCTRSAEPLGPFVQVDERTSSQPKIGIKCKQELTRTRERLKSIDAEHEKLELVSRNWRSSVPGRAGGR